MKKEIIKDTNFSIYTEGSEEPANALAILFLEPVHKSTKLLRQGQYSDTHCTSVYGCHVCAGARKATP